jgi:hypothetical protein
MKRLSGGGHRSEELRSIGRRQQQHEGVAPMRSGTGAQGRAETSSPAGEGGSSLHRGKGEREVFQDRGEGRGHLVCLQPSRRSPIDRGAPVNRQRATGREGGGGAQRPERSSDSLLRVPSRKRAKRLWWEEKLMKPTHESAPRLRTLLLHLPPSRPPLHPSGGSESKDWEKGVPAEM